MSLIATVTAQGRLLEVKVSGYHSKNKSSGGNKKAIKEFSARSRVRLLKLVSRLDISKEKYPVFITLTFAQKYPSPQQAKEYMRLFVRKLNRRSSREVSAIWRLEFQERGAPHFHLIVFGMDYIKKELVSELWGDTISKEYWDDGERPPFTRIEGVQQHRKLIYYVSKYVAKADPKPEGQGSACGFNSVLYSDAIGRFWGIIKRNILPMAEIKRIVKEFGHWFDELRKLCKEFYPWINDEASGFHVYMDKPENFLKFITIDA